MLYPTPRWVQTFVASVGVQGTPALAFSDTLGQVFVAFSAQGTVGALPASASYTIVVAALDVVTGSVLWTVRDPAWTTTSGDTQPTLCLGVSGDLYLAFTTTGTTAGNTNGADAFSFCSPCSGATAGREDVVLVRINVGGGSPVVAWTLQNAYLNSCNRETVPQLAYDTYNQCVILVYETNASTLCSAPVGSGSNIVIAAVNAATGAYVWGYQDVLLNGTGSNRAPSVAVDATGAVYIAYTVTAAVSGGGVLQGAQDVEVVRIRAVGSPVTVVRDWIASAVGVWNPGSGATNGTPALVCDPVRGRLFLAFTTTAVQTASVSDMVLVRLNAGTGALEWILQSATYNVTPVGPHQATTGLQAGMDSLGQPYVAAAGLDANGDGFTAILRPDADVGTTDWTWNDPAIPFVYETYLAGAAFPTPQQIVQATTAFSLSALSVRGGCLHAAFIRPDTNAVVVVGLDQVPTFADLSAYAYMDQKTAICS